MSPIDIYFKLLQCLEEFCEVLSLLRYILVTRIIENLLVLMKIDEDHWEW